MTGCRHEWEAGHFEDAHSGAWAEYACKKCGDLGYEDEVETWNAAMRIAAADLAARDAEIERLKREADLAIKVFEAYRGADVFLGLHCWQWPQAVLDQGCEYQTIATERVARSKGKVQE